MVRDYPGLCRRARDAGWAYEDLLRELLEAEITNRHQSTARRLLREARFPDIKTLDQLDWSALRGVSRPKLMELASCEFIGRAEAVILAGPIGSGKTHLAIAIGVEATRRRLRVHFTRAADLVQSLLEARDERRLTVLQQRYQKVALLIVDELGFVPFERAGGELLFNLLAQRYERLHHHHHQSGVLRVGQGLRRREAHHRAARSPQPPRSHSDHGRNAKLIFRVEVGFEAESAGLYHRPVQRLRRRVRLPLDWHVSTNEHRNV